MNRLYSPIALVLLLFLLINIILIIEGDARKGGKSSIHDKSSDINSLIERGNKMHDSTNPTVTSDKIISQGKSSENSFGEQLILSKDWLLASKHEKVIKESSNIFSEKDFITLKSQKLANAGEGDFSK